MEDQLANRDLLLLGAVVMMTVCMAIGMVTLYARRNIVLGAEWMVMFVSGCNLIVWFFTSNDWQWNLVWYLDAFSRIAGMNLLLYVGFAMLTHNLRLSLVADAFVLGAIALLAAAFMYVEFLEPAKNYAYSAAHFMFTPLLIFLTYEMYQIGKQHLMWLMVMTTIALTVSTVMIDFRAPAENDTNLFFNKDFVSLVSWGLGYLILSRVYVAMEEDSKSDSPKGTMFR